MPRTKEFDPDVVLRSALDLFWQRGYAATSLSDLVEHLGIGRASIYATFGGKHALYLAALDRYAELNGLPELAAPGAALPGVRAVVRRYADEACSPVTGPRGCFVANTATELAPHDPAAARKVAASWDHLESALYAALARARAQGELPADRDPRPLARTLFVLLQGIRVVGKAAAGPSVVHDAAEHALTLLS